MNEETVIIVNENDEEIGCMDKMEAHRQAVLHRAFSIFIFNKQGKMLLQKRAMNKYHSSGRWSNACCSHPLPGEQTTDAALRRLKQEMGFETPLKKVFHFIYRAVLDNELTEFEYDHVFVGLYDGLIQADPTEVSDFCYKSMDEISQALRNNPQEYTAWFPLAFYRLEKWMQSNYPDPVA